MFHTHIRCVQCQTRLPAAMMNTPDFVACPSCLAPIQARVFPAFCRPAQEVATERRLVEGDSTCFYHPGKSAVVPCDHCGRFLCALCDLDLNGRHLCAPCLEHEKSAGEQKKLVTRTTRYDQIVLSLTVLPVLLPMFWFMTIVMAPAALFIAIRFWKAPLSVVPQTRIRFVIGMLLALLEIVGWFALVIFLVYVRRTRS